MPALFNVLDMDIQTLLCYDTPKDWQEGVIVMTPNFVHLHVHTEYSLLDGSNKITECIQQVKALGMNSVAITDHGAMFGVIDFYREAIRQGIHPVIGCEVYVAPNSRFDRELTGGDDRYYHLVLLAENNTGYHNLIKIVSRGYTEGYYYRPRVDKELLRRHSEGLIALSACLAGEVQRYLIKGLYEAAKKAACTYEDIFGKGNFFLELQDHGLSDQQIVNPQLVRMSQETGIDLVATNDVHYTYADDEKAHDILLCIQTGKKLADENRMRYEGGQYYLKSPEEMAQLFPYALEALENTQKIADRCQVEITFGERKLPKYDTPAPYTSEAYLRKLCAEGLQKRYGEHAQEHTQRLEYELSTIVEMGFVDYFLIVWDFIAFAKKNGIIVGPGRGSAAGSIVSYCLEITDIDPIQYQLLFERFLNPERVSMPDIDVDFCFERRQEVIDYVVEKYGKDCVAQIVTFGTMAAKGVVRDVGRVMDLPYAFVDSIAKMIPNDLGMTITKALSMSPDLKKMYEEDANVKYLIDMSLRLEGLPRHTSMHAAGVVITQDAVEEYVPLSRGSDGAVTTQFTMTTLEELGLLKMDFLGLRTLTVIQNAEDLVRGGADPNFSIQNIDYNDQNVMRSIGTGRTDGVFQLESAGMKSFMKELAPKSLEDIIAGISLYRPGPMEFIPQYIKGKNTSDQIQYDTPKLKPILESTYGCIVYQEQVMQIVRELAGYSLGRSDLLRRAMSKKKGDVMAKERQNFVYGNSEEGILGCVGNGISEEIGNKIFDEMVDFAKYAFNKSHAASYAVVSYQTAYLKYYYPKEFMAALMTSVVDNPSKVAEYILSCRQMGIPILPPNVNEGEGRFSVSGDGIRYGLHAIKSIGRPVIEAILEERRQHGKYSSLREFLERIADSGINKRMVENLIKAGAFEESWGTRKQLMQVYQPEMDRLARDKKGGVAGQISLFDLAGEGGGEEFQIPLPDVGEFDKQTILMFEKEVLGVYISGHPLEEYEEKWRRKITAVTTDFVWDTEVRAMKLKDGSRAVIGGMIINRTVKNTRNDKQMAFLTVEDLLGTVEVIVFPRDYERCRQSIGVDEKVFIKGRVSAEEEKDGKLILEEVIPFDQTSQTLWVRFPDKESYLAQTDELLELLSTSEGNCRVRIFLEAERQQKELPANRNVGIHDRLLQQLYVKFGNENIKVVENRVENAG